MVNVLSLGEEDDINEQSFTILRNTKHPCYNIGIQTIKIGDKQHLVLKTSSTIIIY